MGGETKARTETRAELLCLALVITLAFAFLPSALADFASGSLRAFRGWPGHRRCYYVSMLALGLLLAVPSMKRSGLCIGRIRGSVWRVLLVCGLPVVATALVYPQLETRPFGFESVGTWLASVLAQELVFAGYLYGRLDTRFSSYVHRRLHVKWAVVLTALFFSLWHLPNFATVPAHYVVFQLVYTFAGGALVGMSRQWTGSVLYSILSHAAVNLVAGLAS